MRVLVTGANGQLGMALKEESRAHSEHEYLFTDLEELDITVPEAIENAVVLFRPDIFVNCASYNAVDKAEDDPDPAMMINGEAAGYIAGIASRHGISLIHLSTDYVFDGKKGSAYHEDDLPNPLSKYAYSKLLGEQAVRSANCNAAIIRTSWLYSEYGSNFVKTIRNLAVERDEIRVVKDQEGSPTYAGDLAAAIFASMPQIRNLNGINTYHYSNEGVTSWAGFAEAVVELSGLECRIIPVSTSEYGLSKAARPAFSLLDKSKIRETFGLIIPYWYESLEECIDKLEKP